MTIRALPACCRAVGQAAQGELAAVLMPSVHAEPSGYGLHLTRPCPRPPSSRPPTACTWFKLTRNSPLPRSRHVLSCHSYSAPSTAGESRSQRRGGCLSFALAACLGAVCTWLCMPPSPWNSSASSSSPVRLGTSFSVTTGGGSEKTPSGASTCSRTHVQASCSQPQGLQLMSCMALVRAHKSTKPPVGQHPEV
jgi:hypothetical protein